MQAKPLFTIAALFNFSIAGGLLFAWPLLQDLLQLVPVEGSNVFLKNVTAALVAAFGYAYFMAGRDPVTYRPYISLGVIGKLLVVVVALPFLISGGQGVLVAGAALGDLVFAVLFILYLRQHPA